MMLKMMKLRVPMQVLQDKSTAQDCVRTDTDDDKKVVIDFGRVMMADGWDLIQRQKCSGSILYRSPAKGILPSGKYGMMCFKVRESMDGGYYFSAISSAPHKITVFTLQCIRFKTSPIESK